MAAIGGSGCLTRRDCGNAIAPASRAVSAASQTRADLARYERMKVDGSPMRTIWLDPDGWSVGVIDQTALPHRFVTKRLSSLAEAAHAIRAMVVRGAPLIGAAAAY